MVPHTGPITETSLSKINQQYIKLYHLTRSHNTVIQNKSKVHNTLLPISVLVCHSPKHGTAHRPGLLGHWSQNVFTSRRRPMLLQTRHLDWRFFQVAVDSSTDGKCLSVSLSRFATILLMHDTPVNPLRWTNAGEPALQCSSTPVNHQRQCITTLVYHQLTYYYRLRRYFYRY